MQLFSPKLEDTVKQQNDCITVAKLSKPATQQTVEVKSYVPQLIYNIL